MLIVRGKFWVLVRWSLKADLRDKAAILSKFCCCKFCEGVLFSNWAIIVLSLLVGQSSS